MKLQPDTKVLITNFYPLNGPGVIISYIEDAYWEKYKVQTEKEVLIIPRWALRIIGETDGL